MLQVFRIVTPGRVDKMIAFDELPKKYLVGIKKRDESATRGVREFLKTNKCTDKRISYWKNPETGQLEALETVFPFTYMVEPETINDDAMKWQEITSYVRRVVDPTVRLLENIDAMAIPVARDCYTEIEIEMDDVPVIPIKPEIITSRPVSIFESPKVEMAEKEAEKVIVEEIKKKRGRPKKVVEEAGDAATI